MKRIASILLSVCMCFFVLVIFTSCEEEHTHTYKTEWGKDSTYHWHECEGENCLEISDKAEHTWDEGTITNEATAQEEGEKSYSCTVCGAIKGEKIEFTGVSEESWLQSLSVQKFDNVTVNYSLSSSEMLQSHVLKIADGKVYRKMTITMANADPMVVERFFYEEDASVQRTMFFEVFFALLNERDNFVWDSELGYYINSKEVSTTVKSHDPNEYANEVMTNGKVKFDSEGNVEYFSCTLKESVYYNDELKTEVIGEVVWTFSEYGTTVVE